MKSYGGFGRTRAPAGPRSIQMEKDEAANAKITRGANGREKNSLVPPLPPSPTPEINPAALQMDLRHDTCGSYQTIAVVQRLTNEFLPTRHRSPRKE